MAFVHGELILETTTTTGTGTLTLAGVVSGHRTFATGIGEGNTCAYSIEASNGQKETGIGTVGSGTLERTTLKASSTGSKLDLPAGTHYVGVGANSASFTPAATGAQPAMTDASQAEMETGTESALRSMSPLRVAQAARVHAVETPGGRLTLSSGSPVADITGGSTIYYTPYIHNYLPLWNGTIWVLVPFTELSLALGTMTAGIGYDVFAYLADGSPALEMLAWTSSSARATAVTLQDGRYCAANDKTRLLLGSFYARSTTVTDDNVTNRYVTNVYNKVYRRLYTYESTNHTYASATWREWNGGTTPRLNIFSEFGIPVSLALTVFAKDSAHLAVYVNAYMQLPTSYMAGAVNQLPKISTNFVVWLPLGFSVIKVLEQSVSGTSNFYESYLSAGIFQ